MPKWADRNNIEYPCGCIHEVSYEYGARSNEPYWQSISIVFCDEHQP